MSPLVTLRTHADHGTPSVTSRGGVLEVALVLTHACNLACVYCYTGEKKRVRMSTAVAEGALAFAFATAAASGARLQLEFFGGEPLLERELLLAIATQARARAAEVPLRMQMTTNGTLLTRALVDRLGALQVQLALSLDGTRRQHDAGRPLAGGGSSYDATRAALELLLASRERWPFDVIAVVDPCNVGELADGVAQLVELGVESLTLNVNWGGRWDDAGLGELERQLERVAAVFLAWLRRGRWIRIQPLESALRSWLDTGRVVSAACAAGSRRLAVAPSGRLYGCARAVGEDDGRGALGDIRAGLVASPLVAEHGCSCANTEETGDAAMAGPTRIRHHRALERIAARLAAQIGEEFAHIVVTEQGPTP